MSKKKVGENSEYEKQRREAERFYFSVCPVYSPAFKRKVHFSPDGFRHLTGKHGGERDRTEQMSRFKLLPLAVKLLATATAYDTYGQEIGTTQVETSRGPEERNVVMHFWSIVGFVEGQRIRVVVRRVGPDGKLRFLSVYVDWELQARHYDNRFQMIEDEGPEELQD